MAVAGPEGARPDDGPLAEDGEPGELRFEGRALGSSLRLTVRLPLPPDGPLDPAPAVAAWAEVRDEFAAVDLALSRFRDDSELTRLNRLAGSGRVLPVSWRLRRALAMADRAARVTAGRFDATVLGVLERIGERGAVLGGRSAHAGAAAPDATSRAVAPRVPIDLGGIGKGLALRWARDRALRALPQGAGVLLDAGGDLVAGGDPPPDGWSVAIEDPAAADPIAAADPVVTVALPVGAIATSSVRVRHWLAPDGSPVHHLVDPRTREPARTGLIAVTVAGRDPAWAEVWTKALFLAGRGTIGDEARARGLAAWWIDDRGALGMTPGARLRSAAVLEHRLG